MPLPPLPIVPSVLGAGNADVARSAEYNKANNADSNGRADKTNKLFFQWIENYTREVYEKSIREKYVREIYGRCKCSL